MSARWIGLAARGMPLASAALTDSAGYGTTMPCIIRKDIGERYENHVELAADEWALTPQVEALDAWLRANPNGLDPAFRWVADIGFTPRINALGGGPVISRELMERCLNANVEFPLRVCWPILNLGWFSNNTIYIGTHHVRFDIRM